MSKNSASTKNDQLPRVTVLDILPDADPDELIAIPANWQSDAGEAPKIFIEVKRNDLTIPGPGERILARISKGKDQKYSARTMKILARPNRAQIGIIRLSANGARLIPIDRKQKEMQVLPEHLNGARDGDLVEVETLIKGRAMVPMAKVGKIIGNPMSEGAVSLIALHNLEIPYRFDPKTIKAAKEITSNDKIKRENWLKIPFITIDPASAKDHDDAVFAQNDPDKNNPGGFLVYVAIADVASYVTPSSALDKEAYLRGNSVYFPDRVVPMLPERISNDLCSLREGENRPAIAVKMVIDADGNKKDHSFHRVTIKVALKLSYTEAQAAFDGKPNEAAAPFIKPALAPLWQAYKAMAKAREHRAPLDLDLPERKIVLNKDGLVDRVFVPKRMEANRLIEEMMVGANVCAAQTLEKKKTPLIFRVHDSPGTEKLAVLKDFLKSLDINFSTSASIRPQHFNRILHQQKSSEHSHQVSEMVLRTQAQAEYNTQNYGHFGLNLDHYAHFTSPIRRYADLIVHRALISACKLGKDGLSNSEIEKLKPISEHISMTER
ncbi:3'-to-5' exoribonuclease RNase R, partial [hydrothermal vent metagenome]